MGDWKILHFGNDFLLFSPLRLRRTGRPRTPYIPPHRNGWRKALTRVAVDYKIVRRGTDGCARPPGAYDPAAMCSSNQAIARAT